jgi:hypothetical protein
MNTRYSEVNSKKMSKFSKTHGTGKLNILASSNIQFNRTTSFEKMKLGFVHLNAPSVFRLFTEKSNIFLKLRFSHLRERISPFRAPVVNAKRVTGCNTK